MKGAQTEYVVQQQYAYPYGMVATGEMVGTSFKATKKALNRHHDITSKKYNDRKQTGTIKVMKTYSQDVTLEDGSTATVTVIFAGLFRIQGKKVAYAYTYGVQNFNGTKAGTASRAHKAADIIAKKIGVRV